MTVQRVSFFVSLVAMALCMGAMRYNPEPAPLLISGSYVITAIMGWTSGLLCASLFWKRKVSP